MMTEKKTLTLDDPKISKDMRKVLENASNFEAIKPSLRPRLYGENIKKGETKPLVGDINVGIIARLPEGAVIIVDANLLEKWGVNFDEVLQVAISNMEVSVMDLGQFLAGVTGIEPSPLDVPMTIVKTTEDTFGAAAILCQASMDGLRDVMGDFYIIPSSVHEVLVIPTEGNNPDDIREIVGQVNDTCLDPQELLSYELYMYDGQVKLCPVESESSKSKSA